MSPFILQAEVSPLLHLIGFCCISSVGLLVLTQWMLRLKNTHH
jgi:hypothetical protein